MNRTRGAFAVFAGAGLLGLLAVAWAGTPIWVVGVAVVAWVTGAAALAMGSAFVHDD